MEFSNAVQAAIAIIQEEARILHECSTDENGGWGEDEAAEASYNHMLIVAKALRNGAKAGPQEGPTISERLREFNRWRRSTDETQPMPNPKDIGEWIDCAADRLDVLELEVARLTADLREGDALRERMADLLRRTAVALRGAEPPLTRWSWHDLPERAAAAVGNIAAEAGDAPLLMNGMTASTTDETASVRGLVQAQDGQA